jgi:asparagine synthase (glutamine-hydrolysing)
MTFDRHLWLIDESLRLTDATTMGSSVEGRVPFLDPRIIAASNATPAEWHVTLRRTKALLKDTYRSLLPEHLFTLSKASFYPPLAKWLRREASQLVEETLEHSRIREFFNVEAARHLFEEHRAHRRYALHPLSSLVQLRCWFETVYDAAE